MLTLLKAANLAIKTEPPFPDTAVKSVDPNKQIENINTFCDLHSFRYVWLPFLRTSMSQLGNQNRMTGPLRLGTGQLGMPHNQ